MRSIKNLVLRLRERGWNVDKTVNFRDFDFMEHFESRFGKFRMELVFRLINVVYEAELFVNRRFFVEFFGGHARNVWPLLHCLRSSRKRVSIKNERRKESKPSIVENGEHAEMDEITVL